MCDQTEENKLHSGFTVFDHISNDGSTHNKFRKIGLVLLGFHSALDEFVDYTVCELRPGFCGSPPDAQSVFCLIILRCLYWLFDFRNFKRSNEESHRKYILLEITWSIEISWVFKRLPVEMFIPEIEMAVINFYPNWLNVQTSTPELSACRPKGTGENVIRSSVVSTSIFQLIIRQKFPMNPKV